MTNRTWLLLPLLALGGCLTNTPDPNTGGIYACVEDSECPGTQACLQQVCEAITLPVVKILNPERDTPYTHNDGMEDHVVALSINATDMILRPLAESTEAVPGEGHLVVFIDEIEIATIDSGDLGAGVQVPITIVDVPGVHRIRVQARLNDGSDYDHEGGSARNLVWVDDGRQHIALREPWPGQTFSVDSQVINAEVAAFGPGLEISPPEEGAQHVHVFYDESFPACLDDPLCEASYSGVVPSDEDIFGPIILPASTPGMVSLTVLVRNPDHTSYVDPLGDPVFSEIQIHRGTRTPE